MDLKLIPSKFILMNISRIFAFLAKLTHSHQENAKNFNKISVLWSFDHFHVKFSRHWNGKEIFEPNANVVVAYFKFCIFLKFCENQEGW